MKLDLNLIAATVAEMPDRVKQARQAGYDGVFVAETRQDPFLPLSAAVTAAADLDLGTSIALAFPRSPMIMAMSAWGLQQSHGRFILGLGAQVRKHIERRFSCPYERPAARLGEYVRAVRHAWGAFQGEHALDFHGEFYTMDFLPAFANPGPIDAPPPPVYLATVGRRMYRVAGAVADGAFAHPLHTVDYLQHVALPAIREGIAQRGNREAAGFSLSVTVFAVIGGGHDAERMEDDVRARLAFYASTPTYRDVLERAGWDSVGQKLQQMVRAGDHDSMPQAVPDAMLEDFCIRATSWEEATRLLRHRYDGVADRISFYNPPPTDIAIS